MNLPHGVCLLIPAARINHYNSFTTTNYINCLGTEPKYSRGEAGFYVPTSTYKHIFRKVYLNNIHNV
jgi:hypothetical protein